MSRHLGDYAPSTVIYGKFTSFRPSTGAAFTLGGTPALSVYKDNSTTQSTTGVTLTADFDGVTGLHHFAIDTSADGTFYSAGSNFDVVITTGTVDSVSVVGTVVGSFSLAKTAALRPTTAGRTLDVASTGEAGLDLSNVNVPAGQIPFLGIVDNGTAQSATATTLVARAAAPDNSIQPGMTLMAYGSTQGYWQSVLIDSVSGDTYTINAWPLATPSGTITYYVQGTPSGSPNLLPDVNVLQISGDATAANNCESFFDGTGYAGTGNTIPNVTTVNGLAANVITAASMAADAGAEIADAVWDELLAGHAGVGSAGSALSAAGGSGDPWSTAIPGAYGAGTAGYIIGTNLDATVSSRASQTSVNTIDDFLDTEIAAILADTNELQTDWANGGRLDLILDARASQASVDTIDDFLDTEIAALTTELAKVPKSDGTATWNATALASIQAEATDALNAYDPPTRAELTTDINSVLAVVDDLGVKKNTAFSNFEFLMVLTSDHVTPATGLTVTGQRSIDGAAFASVSGTIAEVSNGIYQFDAAAADTNGDVITWRFSAATADDAFVTFKTVA